MIEMKIRDLKVDKVNLQGESSLPFVELNKNNFKLAIEILMKIPDGYQDVLKKVWKNAFKNPLDYAEAALKKKSDFLAVKFNLSEEDVDNIDFYIDVLKEIEKISDRPLIVTGADNNDVDMVILPKIAEALKKECIIGSVNQNTVKCVVHSLKEEQYLVGQSHIDINLAKELNILIADLGFDLDKVLIDTTTGALGYGLDYAYSVFERIKQAAFNGDKYLNMPIIAFVGDEVWKTKETKSTDFPSSWGQLEERAIIWETATAGSFMAAGANIIVVRHPRTLATLDKLVSKG